MFVIKLILLFFIFLNIVAGDHGDHGGHDHGGHDHGGHDHDHDHSHGHHDHNHGGRRGWGRNDNGGGEGRGGFNRWGTRRRGGGGGGGGLLGWLFGFRHNRFQENSSSGYYGNLNQCQSQLIDYVGQLPRFYCNCPPYPPNYQYYRCVPMAYGK